MVLFSIAYILWLPLTVVNYFFVKDKGYFRNSALNIDKFANREFRTLWNKTLIKENGYQFGAEDETISSVLGKNLEGGTLTKKGKVLVGLLSKQHVINAINKEEIK